MNNGFPTTAKSLEVVLQEFGRIGGPTPHGWHTIDPMFHCWRLYQFTRQPKPTPTRTSRALAVGTIFHEFMAIYYSPHLKPTPPQIPYSVDQLQAHLIASGYIEETAEARRLYNAYLQYYRINDGYLSKDVQIVAVEELLERQLPWGAPYTVRLDLVLKLPDGYWIADHKTTWARTSEFAEGWQVDPSVLGMLWTAQAKYSPLRGASINGVIKTKNPDFDRFTFALDERIIADWVRMVEYKYAEERSARLVAGTGADQPQNWPPNFKSCFGKYGRCGFFEQCVYGV